MTSKMVPFTDFRNESQAESPDSNIYYNVSKACLYLARKLVFFGENNQNIRKIVTHIFN